MTSPLTLTAPAANQTPVPMEDGKTPSGSPSTVTPLESKENVEEGPQPLENNEVLTVTPPMRRKGWLQYAVLCYTFFVTGWNDGTLGPLLPRLQSVYHVCFTLCRSMARCLTLLARSCTPSCRLSSSSTVW